MCSLSNNDEKSCCTPLCIKRKKDAAVCSWYYAPTGTTGILDTVDGQLYQFKNPKYFTFADDQLSGGTGTTGTAATALYSPLSDETVVSSEQQRGYKDRKAKHICIVMQKPRHSKQLYKHRQGKQKT